MAILSVHNTAMNSHVVTISENEAHFVKNDNFKMSTWQSWRGLLVAMLWLSQISLYRSIMFRRDVLYMCLTLKVSDSFGLTIRLVTDQTLLRQDIYRHNPIGYLHFNWRQHFVELFLDWTKETVFHLSVFWNDVNWKN